ncbi:MAG: hypothetical protein KZQ56_03545 [gamma proteobacterium symbiont of Lucinoma myriamae]|nr:hypothetical protein [gamma proteobacterium symbiont of Lucinoma myriamae]
MLTWGGNTSGQLGDGTTDDRFAAGLVSDESGNPLTGIKAVAVHESYTVALKSDGTVFSWGLNNLKQLGDGTSDTRYYPVQVVDAEGNPVTGIQAIALSRYTTLALKSDGSLLIWGLNLPPSPVLYKNSSPPVTPYEDGTAVAGIKAISAGTSHFMALKTDGILLAWGSNHVGQLGRPNYPHPEDGYPYPVMLDLGSFNYEPLSPVKTMAAGENHSIAVLEDGSLMAWGKNDYGQLGDGTRDDRDYPVAMRDASDNPFSANPRSLTAGERHSIIHLVNGTLLVSGMHLSYYDDELFQTLTPTLEIDPKGIPITGIEVVAASGYTFGSGHNFALQNNGNLLVWGNNNFYGQLGIETRSDYLGTFGPATVIMAADPDTPISNTMPLT